MRQANHFNRLKRSLQKNAMQYLLLLLPITYIIVFKYVPMYGAQIAFRDYRITKGIWESPWVGFKHFEKFLTNRMFKRVMVNTLRINLYSLLTFPCSIIFAFMLHYVPYKRFRKTVQLVSYAPHFISTVVMCGLILNFFSTYGLINQLRSVLGLESVNYLSNANAFTPLYIWTGVWQGVGYGSILYVSALSGVDYDLHEAAIMDGATILKRIWHIDLPSILPMIVVMLVLRCGSLLSVGYEKVYLLQNDLNIKASEVISTYVWKQGVSATLPQYSYSTAVGLFTSVINLSMLVIVNNLSKKLTQHSIW
jgi:putative aldouronate transport system permease protein